MAVGLVINSFNIKMPSSTSSCLPIAPYHWEIWKANLLDFNESITGPWELVISPCFQEK